MSIIIKKNTQLIHFTVDEEKAIQRAIAKSKKYMETYGKPPVIPAPKIASIDEILKELNDDTSVTENRFNNLKTKQI